MSHFIPQVDLNRGMALTHASVSRLSQLVVSALLSRGVPAITVSPFGVGVRAEAESGTVPASATHELSARIRDLLDAGLVPVVHGYGFF